MQISSPIGFSMSDHPQLIHNMSAPPRSSIKMPKRYDDRVVIKVALSTSLFVGDWEFNILKEYKELTSDPISFDEIIDSYMTKFNLPQIYPILSNQPKSQQIISVNPFLACGLLLHASPTLLIPTRRIPTSQEVLQRVFYITNISFLELLLDRHFLFPEIISQKQQRQIVAYLAEKH